MDEEKCVDQMEEDELIPSLKLSKKMTMMDSSLNDVSLKLCKDKIIQISTILQSMRMKG